MTQFQPESFGGNAIKPHRGTLILVFGIVGIVTCLPLAIAAWIMGNSDLKEMQAGTMDPSGRDHTSAGRICGMIGVILGIIGFCIGMVMLFMLVIFGAAAAASASGAGAGGP